MSDALTSLKGSLYVQFSPDESPEYMGQVTLDALAEPRGDITVVQAETVHAAIETVNTARSAPVGLQIAITALTFPEQDLIDEIGDCTVTLYITQDCQGRKGVLDAYDRCYIIHHAALAQITRDGLAHRVADTESTRKLEFTAGTPVYVVGHVETLARIATSSADDWLDIAVWKFKRCGGLRGAEQGWCDYRIAITEVPQGSPAPAADVFYSLDGGATWTATAAHPFTNGVSPMACAIFPVHEGTIRLLVARYNDGEIAYSDDWGATWTTITYEADDPLHQCHGVYTTNSLFYLDGHNLWLVADCSHLGTSIVFVSYTSGETWVELGTVSDAAKSIFFCDPDHGFMGAGDGRVYVTVNGGLTWTMAVDTGAGYQFHSLYAFNEKHVLAGASDGAGVYETFDGWATWAQPAISAFLTTAGTIVCDIDFYNPLCGFILAYNTVSKTSRLYWTMDGGRYWHEYDPGVSVLQSMVVCGPEEAMAVGEVNAGTAAIINAT